MNIITNLLLTYILSSFFSIRISSAFERPWVKRTHVFRKYKKADSVTKDENQCFYIESDPSLAYIPELLAPTGNDLERIVVYIYRDTVTKKISTYTPNIEKQRLIPDLHFEPDDSIGKDAKETISSFFKHNSNVVNIKYAQQTLPPDLENKRSTLYDDQDKNVPLQDVTSEPITGKIKHVPSKLVLYTYGNLNSDNIPNKPEKLVPEMISKVIIEKSSPTSNLIPEADTIYSVEPNTQEDVIFEENKLKTKLQKVDSSKTTQPVRITSQDTDSSSVVIGGDNFGKLIHNSASFDLWFKDQMERIQTDQSSKSNSIDIDMLKKVIEQTLSENGMIVSNSGILTDSDGKILDISNLKLRPILIGKSFSLDNVKQKAVNNKYILSENVPYLESILITLINPPQVFGIVPLGMVHFPKESVNEKVHTEPNKSIQQDYTIKQVTDIDSETKKPIKHRPSYKKLNKIIKESRRLIAGTNKKSKNPSTRKSKKKNHEIKGESNSSRADIFLRNLVKSVRDNEIGLSDIMSKTRKAGQQLGGLVLNSLNDIAQDDNRQESPVVLDVSSDEDGDAPDFRIIGGDPATSSGLNLSLKGRSGFIQ